MELQILMQASNNRHFPFTMSILSLIWIVLLHDIAPCIAQTAAPHAPTEPATKPSMREIPIERAPDAALEERLRTIFSGIDDFGRIEIDVVSGVVTLRGSTSSVLLGKEAASLASRLEGVVYVQNKIGQDTEMEPRIHSVAKKFEKIATRLANLLPLILMAILNLVFFWLLSTLIGRWDWPYRRLGINALLTGVIRQFLRSLIVLVGLFIAFDILDLTTLMGAVIGTAGVLGIAIGFAFRDIVENYISGLLLSFRSPFLVNDLVLVGSQEGKVVRMTAREMILLTLDGNQVRVPNATVFKSTIRNYTRNPMRRFDFSVGVGLDEDLLFVQEVARRTLEAMEGVLKEPAPFMLVEEIGNSSVNVRFFGWVDQRKSDWFKVRSQAMRLVKKALDYNLIGMPFETYALHIQKFRSMALPKAMREGRTGQELESYKPEPVTSPSIEHEARSADVAVEKYLDKAIEEDLSMSAEGNLLPDGTPAPSPDTRETKRT